VWDAALEHLGELRAQPVLLGVDNGAGRDRDAAGPQPQSGLWRQAVGEHEVAATREGAAGDHAVNLAIGDR
jgi:hypothetical protein